MTAAPTRVVALYAKRAQRGVDGRLMVHLIDLRHDPPDGELLEPLLIASGAMGRDALLERLGELYERQRGDGRLHLVLSPGAVSAGLHREVGGDRTRPANERWRVVIEPFTAVGQVQRSVNGLASAWAASVSPKVIKPAHQYRNQAKVPIETHEREVLVQQVRDLMRVTRVSHADRAGALRRALDPTPFGTDTWAAAEPLDVDEIVGVWSYLMQLAAAMRPQQNEPHASWRERLATAYRTPAPPVRQRRSAAALQPDKEENGTLARFLLAAVPEPSKGDPRANTHTGRYHAVLASRRGLRSLR